MSTSFGAAQRILFLNTILSFSCSITIFLGIRLFKGIFHQWAWLHSKYSWIQHIQMCWFDVGCIGLTVLNITSLLLFKKDTGTEAFVVVYVVNATMHGLWGIHNFHQIFRNYITKQDKNTIYQIRRMYPFFLFSIVGCCGSATIRNIYAIIVAPDYNTNFGHILIIVTWIWEWISLVGIFIDFMYFVVKEHKWAANMIQNTEISINTKTAEALQQASTSVD